MKIGRRTKIPVTLWLSLGGFFILGGVTPSSSEAVATPVYFGGDAGNGGFAAVVNPLPPERLNKWLLSLMPRKRDYHSYHYGLATLALVEDGIESSARVEFDKKDNFHEYFPLLTGFTDKSTSWFEIHQGQYECWKYFDSKWNGDAIQMVTKANEELFGYAYFFGNYSGNASEDVIRDRAEINEAAEMTVAVVNKLYLIRKANADLADRMNDQFRKIQWILMSSPFEPDPHESSVVLKSHWYPIARHRDGKVRIRRLGWTQNIRMVIDGESQNIWRLNTVNKAALILQEILEGITQSQGDTDSTRAKAAIARILSPKGSSIANILDACKIIAEKDPSLKCGPTE